MTSTSEIAKPMMGDATDRTAEQRQKLRTDAKAPVRSGYLFSPIFDFLCLGGGSLFVLGIIALLVPASSTAIVAVTMMVLAHFVNNPHFAHSYQIFYSDFGTKAFNWTTPPWSNARLSKPARPCQWASPMPSRRPSPNPAPNLPPTRVGRQHSQTLLQLGS